MSEATTTTPGQIILSGDLTGEASAPQLRPTGVIPGTYTLPTMVVDSKGRTIWAKNGNPGDVAIATTKRLGTVKPDGNTILVNDGSISFSRATNTASASSVGYFSIGSTLNIDSNTVSVPTASGTRLGIVKVGANLNVASDGTVSTSASIQTPGIATTSSLGLIKGSSQFPVSSGVLSAAIPSASNLGFPKIGGGFNISNGFLNVVPVGAATTSSVGVVKTSSFTETKTTDGQTLVTTVAGGGGFYLSYYSNDGIAIGYGNVFLCAVNGFSNFTANNTDAISEREQLSQILVSEGLSSTGSPAYSNIIGGGIFKAVGTDYEKRLAYSIITAGSRIAKPYVSGDLTTAGRWYLDLNSSTHNFVSGSRASSGYAAPTKVTHGIGSATTSKLGIIASGSSSFIVDEDGTLNAQRVDIYGAGSNLTGLVKKNPAHFVESQETLTVNSSLFAFSTLTKACFNKFSYINAKTAGAGRDFDSTGVVTSVLSLVGTGYTPSTSSTEGTGSNSIRVFVGDNNLVSGTTAKAANSFITWDKIVSTTDTSTSLLGQVFTVTFICSTNNTLNFCPSSFFSGRFGRKQSSSVNVSDYGYSTSSFTLSDSSASTWYSTTPFSLSGGAYSCTFKFMPLYIDSLGGVRLVFLQKA